VAGGLLASSVRCDARSLVKCHLQGTSAGCGQNVVELVTVCPAPETARTALSLSLNPTLPLKVTDLTLLLLLSRLWWPWHLGLCPCLCLCLCLWLAYPSRPSRPLLLRESACERAPRPLSPFPSSCHDPFRSRTGTKNAALRTRASERERGVNAVQWRVGGGTVELQGVRSKKHRCGHGDAVALRCGCSAGGARARLGWRERRKAAVVAARWRTVTVQGCAVADGGGAVAVLAAHGRGWARGVRRRRRGCARAVRRCGRRTVVDGDVRTAKGGGGVEVTAKARGQQRWKTSGRQQATKRVI
jgi:hypothetical protein